MFLYITQARYACDTRAKIDGRLWWRTLWGRTGEGRVKGVWERKPSKSASA